jgi:hypothetical protein
MPISIEQVQISSELEWDKGFCDERYNWRLRLMVHRYPKLQYFLLKEEKFEWSFLSKDLAGPDLNFAQILI